MHLELAQKVLQGKKAAVARLITWVENNHPQANAALEELYPHTGHAHLIGITGAPGTGKSSLVNQIAKAYRQQNKTVAIVAIDPSSPFSGGAILGDRIRMRELSGDPGVFIRSMASRGSLGGLAITTHDVIKVFDAAKYDIILIETVGAGQAEVEIARAAHTVIVVEAPGLGDDIQAIKAGILEIADIFAVNKSDRSGANRAVATLKTMLELGHTPAHRVMHHGVLMTIDEGTPNQNSDEISMWQIPVIPTMALKGEGIQDLITEIDKHYQHLNRTQELTERNRARLADELENHLQNALMKQLLSQFSPDYLSNIITKLVNRKLSPYNAVEMILKDFAS